VAVKNTTIFVNTIIYQPHVLTFLWCCIPTWRWPN